jgi:hypothetical protein
MTPKQKIFTYRIWFGVSLVGAIPIAVIIFLVLMQRGAGVALLASTVCLVTSFASFRACSRSNFAKEVRHIKEFRKEVGCFPPATVQERESFRENRSYNDLAELAIRLIRTRHEVQECSQATPTEKFRLILARMEEMRTKNAFSKRWELYQHFEILPWKRFSRGIAWDEKRFLYRIHVSLILLRQRRKKQEEALQCI